MDYLWKSFAVISKWYPKYGVNLWSACMEHFWSKRARYVKNNYAPCFEQLCFTFQMIFKGSPFGSLLHSRSGSPAGAPNRLCRRLSIWVIHLGSPWTRGPCFVLSCHRMKAKSILTCLIICTCVSDAVHAVSWLFQWTFNYILAFYILLWVLGYHRSFSEMVGST